LVANLADVIVPVKARNIYRFLHRQPESDWNIKDRERRSPARQSRGTLTIFQAKKAVAERTQQLRQTIVEGAQQLLARAVDNYEVPMESLQTRIQGAVEKYVLKDDEDASINFISEFINKLQADDLCLIIGCEQGNQRAWADLVERFSPTVRSAARSASSNEDGAEDLAQSIWAELHGVRARADGKPAGKLAYYSGRGSLAGWLRAVVAQLAIDQHRKQSRLVQTDEDADFDRMTQRDGEGLWSNQLGAGNPELEASQKIAGGELQHALTRSISKLPAEDRLLIKLYYFDGLRLREAGAVLGVHEATASRRLTRVHTDLREHVEKILIDEKNWTREETSRAFSELAVHLQTDIEPMLATEGGLVKETNELAG
jgi:RNA polymerase sigma-70 factor